MVGKTESYPQDVGQERATPPQNNAPACFERVLANSPMSQAGLRDGDVIAAIGGIPAKEYTLDRLRQMFKGEGQEYRLEIQRGDQTWQVKIKLRKLI